MESLATPLRTGQNRVVRGVGSQRQAQPWSRQTLVLAILVPCGSLGALQAQTEAPAVRSQPLAPAQTNSSGTLFESLPSSRTGVDFALRWAPPPQYERLLNSSAVGGGVAVGDFDSDGLPDLCLTRPTGGPRLYRNLGDFRFADVTRQSGMRDDDLWTTGAAFADLNGDGRLDLYICCYDSPNRLYINQGDGTFAEQAKAFGLDFSGASLMMAFGDYDRDGHLDGYLLTAGLIPKPSQRFRVDFVDGRPVVPEELQEYWQMFYLPGERAAAAEAGQFDHLYRNNGDGTFADVSRAAGISGCDFGNAVIWWDYNHDGWPDLYVANDYFGPDRLYRNNRNGSFTEVSRDVLPHTPWTSMGADAADLNNDGLIDLVGTDMSGTTHYQRMIDMIDVEKSGWFLDYAEPRQYMRNALFFNTGMNRFLETAYLSHFAHTDWTWSVVAGDLDNDTRVDIFIPNGMTRNWMDVDLAKRAKALPPSDFASFWRAQPIRADTNLAFRNLGEYRFESVGPAWGLNHPGPSFGAVMADLDRDGDLDLVVNNFEKPARILRNGGQGQHQVVFRLEGAAANRFAIGATLRLETATGHQLRYLTGSHGFMSSAEPFVHFGLGPENRIRQLTVLWPAGLQTTYQDLPADCLYTLTEPAAFTPAAPPPSPPVTLLVPSIALAGLQHQKTPFDDFQRQPLLPWKLSQFGPGLACGDIDGDGDPDLYLSGSPQAPGVLYRNEGRGIFRAASQPAFAPGADEMAPLFLDVNGDGAQDLFVVTGGVESDSNDPSLRDRLYLNDGTGRFSPAPEGTLPDLRDSGSTAVAADFDRDGDLDLFVGGRSIPGQYPLTPRSRLLRHDAGRFTDVTDATAPGLSTAGLVTSAVWSDADGDGWVDLLLGCEWGPVRLFHNQQGQLVDQTREAGLADHLGWWNSIAAGDLDRDGDIDYVVGNLGRNSRYQPTRDNPCHLYFGDFAGSGSPQIIEAWVSSGVLLPLRGKSALEKAVPSISEKVLTFHAYASATLTDLVGDSALQSALRLTATTADSSILLNLGNGRFEMRPLPPLAQVAPSFGTLLLDVDADTWLDLVLVQNFSGPQRETGRMNGGVGLALLGAGDATFNPLWPNQSGFVVADDARSLVTMDVNDDGAPDLVVGVHNGELKAFETTNKEHRRLQIRLQGRRGNPAAVGARVALRLRDGSRQTAEVYAGGGYLSQSDNLLHFGLGATGEVDSVQVRWPTGKETQHAGPFPTGHLRIREE